MDATCIKYEIRNAYRVLVGRLKIHIGLVKLIAATLQVVKDVEAIFYCSLRMYFVMFKGKCSLSETYICKSENAIFMRARWSIAVFRSLCRVYLSSSCASLSCFFSAMSLEIFSYSCITMLNTTCRNISKWQGNGWANNSYFFKPCFQS